MHNIILVDTAYLDHVAFDLIVNFERMLGRQIPQGDFPKWLDCIALDGGLRPADNETRVYLIHPKAQTQLQHLQGHFQFESLRDMKECRKPIFYRA